MKTVNSGIVRRIDDLGRVVIPKEMRRMAGVKEGDPFEIGIANGCIILEKYTGEIDEDTGKPKPQDNDGSPVRAVKVAEPKKITLYIDNYEEKAYKSIEEIAEAMVENDDIDNYDQWLCQNYTASSIVEMINSYGYEQAFETLTHDYEDYKIGAAEEIMGCKNRTQYFTVEVEI